MTEAKPLTAQEIAKRIMLAWSDEIPRRPTMVFPPAWMAQVAADAVIATIEARDAEIKRLREALWVIRNGSRSRESRRLAAEALAATEAVKP